MDPLKGLSSTAKPLHSCGFLFLDSMDDKPFTNTHTHTHTHKAHPQTYANLLCDTRLEAHVSHANETDPASSRQHVDVLHRRASLQKLKSFSPPSPVMVTVMGRRCAIILSPTHCKRIKNLSLCLVFFSLNKEKQAQIQISNTVPVISLPHIY